MPLTGRHLAAGAVVAVLLAAIPVASAFEEDLGRDDLLRIENRTDERIVVVERGRTDPSQVVLGLLPGESGRAPLNACEATELVAHTGSPDGPVVATRVAAEGHACGAAWKVRRFGAPPDFVWTSSP